MVRQMLGLQWWKIAAPNNEEDSIEETTNHNIIDVETSMGWTERAVSPKQFKVETNEHYSGSSSEDDGDSYSTTSDSTSIGESTSTSSSSSSSTAAR